MIKRSKNILPGFTLSLGFSLTFISIIVFLPLAALALKSTELSFQQFIQTISHARSLSAIKLTFFTAIMAAAINMVIGMLVAWVFVRYEFPFKQWIDALIDLPFALPTAVAGLVYANLYMRNGWVGQILALAGIDISYSSTAIILVLVFTGFPFVVRAVQPVLEEIEPELEEAAAILGASRLQTFCLVLWPMLRPAVVTGFALALARGLGEYGSVIFVSSNLPGQTEVAPTLIVARIEENKYAEATALALVLLTASFCLLGAINFWERWSRRHE